MKPKLKVQVTKNYRLFVRSADNRDTDLKKHRKLIKSMKLYGFLSWFPIVCVRGEKGELIVKDGQHRLQIAESMGLPVYWTEAAEDFDIATERRITPRPWSSRSRTRFPLARRRRCWLDARDLQACRMPSSTGGSGSRIARGLTRWPASTAPWSRCSRRSRAQGLSRRAWRSAESRHLTRSADSVRVRVPRQADSILHARRLPSDA